MLYQYFSATSLIIKDYFKRFVNETFLKVYLTYEKNI